MAHEFTQEEWRLIELGREMYTIYQDAERAYFDREFYPGFKPQVVIPLQREVILLEADLLAKARGHEKYDPTAYRAAVDMVSRAEQEDRDKAIREAIAKREREWASEAKAQLWEEVLITELKNRGVYNKKTPLDELERKHLAWHDYRDLRWTANGIAMQRGYKFRY